MGQEGANKVTLKLMLTSPCSWEVDTDWCDTQGFLLPGYAPSFSHVPNTHLKPNLSNPPYDLSLNHLKTVPSRVLPSALQIQPDCEHSLS